MTPLLRHPGPRPRGSTARVIAAIVALVAGLLIAAPSGALADPAASVTATALGTGQVELTWSLSGGTTSSLEIHRSTDPNFTPSADNLLYQLPGIAGQYGDFTTKPGQTYYYRVVSADGTASAAVPATTPAQFTDTQRHSFVWLDTTASGTTVQWRLSRDQSMPVRLVGGPAAVRQGNLAGATTLAAVNSRQGSWSQPAGTSYDGYALAASDGTVLATAGQPLTSHPRIGITPAQLPALRQLAAGAGTPGMAYRAMKQLVDAGSPDVSLYQMAEFSAFVYLINGDGKYADQAFQNLMASASYIPGQTQPLEVANTATQLALTYDWAYQGWTGDQRQQALEQLKMAVAKLSTMHATNIDTDADKASNWVAVIRGAELLTDLAARGDGDFGLWSERLPTLLDEVQRNMDEAYSDTGWYQEGWDYLSYATDSLGSTMPAVQAAGIDALNASWHRPRFAELALHTLALSPQFQRTQFGVGERTGQIDALPFYLSQASTDVQPYLAGLIDRLTGPDSAMRDTTVNPMSTGAGSPWMLINWPGQSKDPSTAPPSMQSALMDDHAGAYDFRNRIVNSDDVLAGLTNRNHDHFGWSQAETFGLSLTGEDTTWARMPAKDWGNHPLFSEPMVDGNPPYDKADAGGADPASGEGVTLASHSYPGQGGGYVSLDGSGNYQVQKARRDAVVDMRDLGTANAVLAFHDQFADSASHTWDWQMAPEPGVTITTYADGFLLQREDSWVRGWVLNPGGAQILSENGDLKVRRTGTQADFRIVLAVGRGHVVNGDVAGSSITIQGSTYNTDDLASFTPRPPTPVPPAPTQPTLWLKPPPLPFMGDQTQVVTAYYGWWSKLQDSGPVSLKLDAPAGWQVTPLDPTPTLTYGQTAALRYQITVPTGAPPGPVTLRATSTQVNRPQVSDSFDWSVVRTNWALGQPARMSSTINSPSLAVDGNTDGIFGHGSVAHSVQQVQPWWEVDLGQVRPIQEIDIWGRTDCCPQRVSNYYVFVSNNPFGNETLSQILARNDVWSNFQVPYAGRPSVIDAPVQGRYVRIENSSTAPGYMMLAEVQVFPTKS